MFPCVQRQPQASPVLKKDIEEHQQEEYTRPRDDLLDDIRPHGPLEKSAAERNQPIQRGLGSF